METQHSKIQYFGSDLTDLVLLLFVGEKLNFTLSGVREVHDMCFWVFPFDDVQVGIPYRAA